MQCKYHDNKQSNSLPRHGHFGAPMSVVAAAAATNDDAANVTSLIIQSRKIVTIGSTIKIIFLQPVDYSRNCRPMAL